MNYRITRNIELYTTRWSGGTTTQLGIYPGDALYADRNFMWRISTATVEVAESEFTPLPGVERIIMVLDGELELRHKGHHHVMLQKFDQDAFRGDWETRSFGMVTDFNLMMNNATGRIDAVEVKPHESCIFKQRLELGEKSGAMFSVIFYFMAPLRITLPGEEIVDVGKGDVLCVNGSKEQLEDDLGVVANNNSDQCVKVIQTSILHN